MREIIIATKNQGKRREFQELFKQYDISVKSLLDFNEEIPDIEETGKTFQENARIKASAIATKFNKIVLADDSGLVVHALDGRPGVYSARFAGEPKDDQRNNEKLLDELSNHDDRRAKFVCVLACVFPNNETIFAEGICEGEIAPYLTGENGFGYDSLFIPTGYQNTMAQLDADEKNKISHRYHALQQLEKILQQKGLLGDNR